MPDPVEAAPVLRLEDVTVTYRRRRTSFTALENVGVTIGQAEIVGLVGESGSGKTTLGRTPFGLVPITAGRVLLDGEDITSADRRRRRSLTASVQMVFQNPYGSLNPVRTIGDTLAEPVLAHEPRLPATRRDERTAAALERVGLPAAAARRLPREFSGGQRQRIAIARALMTNPRLLVCDESVSALDLSVQAQILNLLTDLRAELRISLLFISHDLTVVRHIADRVVVLYRGRVMEEAVATAPARHPYTDALHLAAPVPDPAEQRRRRELLAARLRPADDAGDSTGCVFAARCPHAVGLCRTTVPRLLPLPADAPATPHRVSCHRASDLHLPPSVFEPSRNSP